MLKWVFLSILFSFFISPAVFATDTIIVSGLVPSDCTIVTGTMPTSAVIGGILRNPGTGGSANPINIPITCSTFNAVVQMNAATSTFRGTLTSPVTNIQYTAAITGTVLPGGPTSVPGTTLASTITSMGNITQATPPF